MKSKRVAEALTKVLADTFVLYFKTHSFHWNVTGPHFKSLHELFEEQYTAMWEATDEIAERIRSLNEYAPNNYVEMSEKAEIQPSSQTPDAQSMLDILADDNRTIVKSIYEALRVAEEEGDEVTVDLMVQRSTQHEQFAWMLESSKDK